VTVRKIAAAAGVSPITVSRALRDDPRVRPETRAQVKAVAERLGYRVNPLVNAVMARLHSGDAAGGSGLSLGIVNPLGVVLPQHPQARVRALAEGIRRQAERVGATLNEFLVGGAVGLRPERLDQVLHARGIRAVIVFYFGGPVAELALDWSRYAAATVGYSLREPDLHRAVPDQYHNLRRLAGILRGRGYSRIGLVLDESSDARTDALWRAAHLTLDEKGEAGPPPFVVSDLYSPENKRRLGLWLRRHRVDAVISNHDPVLGMLRDLGGVVPEKLGFAQLDCDPALTISGMDQRFDAVGAALVDLVIGQLTRNEYGLPEGPKIVQIPGRWHEGETVRAAVVK
jgi:LacI family transcriptional regulator